MSNQVIQRNELQNGTSICGGKYTITAKIGAGGFGITYKAVHNNLDIELCIKEFFLDGRCMRNSQTLTVTTSEEHSNMFDKYRRAFVEEAKVLARLQHPGVVKVLDIFDENGTSYIVMEYINGESLQSIVEKRGVLSYAEAVNYIAQVADSLNYIHERHLLHRDIKPDNIMITPDFKAILIDFGSARLFEEDKTQRHTVILTHGYAPPEQYSEKSRKGSYTDIYALGATLYFILTGVVPIEATLRLIETLTEPKSINAAIPDEANATIVKAMQIQASDRYQTTLDFMADLRNTKTTNKAPEQTASTQNKPIISQSEQTAEDNYTTSWVEVGAFILILVVLMLLLLS